MIKYIKPAIDIEKFGITMEIMAGTTPQPGTGLADGEAANQGIMSDSDDEFPFTGTNLWDED